LYIQFDPFSELKRSNTAQLKQAQEVKVNANKTDSILVMAMRR
jgi:hypothetical protein